jgi:hypothetical protein
MINDPVDQQLRLGNELVPAGAGAAGGSRAEDRGGSVMTSTLPNGIQLPAEWPPRHLDPASDAPMPVPYLDNPPDVIPIDLGRQLFVDDFLIAESALERVFHQPRKHDGNPVFASINPWKRDGIHPAAVPKSGGVWWDPAARCLKMWYEDGWLGSQAFAVSSDGLHWERAVQNIVPGMRPDSGTVWLALTAE